LIITLIELSQQQGEDGEDRVSNVEQIQQRTIFQTILRLYEEVSEVMTVSNEDDLNPYWTLLNPILRWQHNQFLKARKEGFYRSSQFFNKQELSVDYFLYKLNQIE